MARRDEQETTISWMGTDENAEVFTNMPGLIKRLERRGFEATTSKSGTTFEIPIGVIFGGKTSTGERTTNRPVKTHDEKVAHLFRLRKGKMEKAQGKALTKKQTKELEAYCEERVTLKEREEAETEPEQEEEPAPKPRASRTRKPKPEPEPEPEDEDEDEEDEDEDFDEPSDEELEGGESDDEDFL